MSTLQARITAAASWSSTSASSRCSSVAYSWCRSLASARARWSDCSRLRENVGIRFSSLLVASAVARSPRYPSSKNSLLPTLPGGHPSPLAGEDRKEACFLTLCHAPSDRSPELASVPAPTDAIPGPATGRTSFLLHHTLQRMLMFSRKVHNLRHFSFCDLVSENSAFADAVVMDVQHDPRRRLSVL